LRAGPIAWIISRDHEGPAMSATKDTSQARRENAKRLAKAASRFAVTFAIVLLLQLGVEDTQTPAYRLVAFCQVIVGFGFMTAVMAGLLRLEFFKNVHPLLLLTVYVVGCVACSSLLATMPARRARSWSWRPATGRGGTQTRRAATRPRRPTARTCRKTSKALRPAAARA
jgi:hypothetical protein